MEVTFEDYREEEVKLSQKVWEEHIQVDHPRMTIEIIEAVLKGPQMVCESQHENMKNHRLYYSGPWENDKKKTRYYRVVLKDCEDGTWITTAHIRSKVACGKVLYEGE